MIVTACVVLLVGLLSGIHGAEGEEERERAAAGELRMELERWAGQHGFGELHDVADPARIAPEELPPRMDRVLAAHAARGGGGRLLTVLAFAETGEEGPGYRILVSLDTAAAAVTAFSWPSKRSRLRWARDLAPALALGHASALALERAAVEVDGALHAGGNRLHVLHCRPTFIGLPKEPKDTARLAGLLDATARLADVLGGSTRTG